MTYRELKSEGVHRLRDAGIAEPESDAELLLLHLTGKSRTELLFLLPDPAPEAVRTAFSDLVSQRCTHIPVQHLIGSAPFYGYDFLVSPDTLIPRFDTEILVHEVLCHETNPDIRVLDLCTGTGCIAITLKKEGGYREVLAADLSAAALGIARQNAERLSAVISFSEGDLLQHVEGELDVIVSNPPYISDAEILTLSPEVREHDPMMALSGGADGLLFYRRITKECLSHLKCGGRLYFEIGYDQEHTVSALMSENGFTDVTCVHDLSGLPRVVYGTRRQ